MPQYQQVCVSTELHLMFVSPLVLPLSVNFLGKDLFLNGKVMFIFEKKTGLLLQLTLVDLFSPYN